MLHSIWRYAGRKHFTEHEDVTIYGLTSGNKPLKARLYDSWRLNSSSGLGQDTRTKTFTNLHVSDGSPASHIPPPSQTLSEGLCRPSTDVKVRCDHSAPGKGWRGKAVHTWHHNMNHDMQIHGSSGTSFNWKQVREVPSLQQTHIAQQTNVNVTTVLKIYLVLLLLSWGYQVILSPQSWQCRSWSGWRPFCSGGSETFGTTLCVNHACCCPEGLLLLASWEDPQVLLFPVAILSCLLCWWRGKEEEEITASFIQAF